MASTITLDWIFDPATFLCLCIVSIIDNRMKSPLNPIDYEGALCHQLLDGCNSIRCDTIGCRSCALFREKFVCVDNVKEYANDCMRNHPEKAALCAGLSPIVFRSDILHKAHQFDEAIENLIRNNNESSPKFDISNAVLQIFNDPDAFLFIMDTNSTPITKSDIAVDDQAICSLLFAFHERGPFFVPFANQFYELLQNLVSTTFSATYHHLRGLFFLSLFSPYYTFSTVNLPLIDLSNHILSLDGPSKAEFLCFYSLHPLALREFLSSLQMNVDILLLQSATIDFSDPVMKTLSNMIGFLQNANTLSSNQLKFDFFSNDLLTNSLVRSLETDPNFQATKTIKDYVPLITLDLKERLLRTSFRNSQNNTVRQQLFNIIFVHDENAHISPRDFHLVIEVDRNNLVEDTVAQISRIPAEKLTSKLLVIFKGEQGVDAGGVSREFFYLLMDDLFSPKYGMFNLIDSTFYWFNPLSLESPLMFSVLGTVVGLAIYNSVILPIRFPLAMYKKLVGTRLTLSDLEEIDSEAAHSLSALEKVKKDGGDVSESGLTFSVLYDKYGCLEEADLIPNGRNEAVTNANLDIYVERYINWVLVGSVSIQFSAFQRGLEKLCRDPLFSVLTPAEFDVIVSGEEVLDWEALKASTQYVDGYTAESQSVKDFWEIFNEMSPSEKKKFLIFSTGSDRAPVGGLANIDLILQRTGDPTKLPVAHTCFNIFSLPDYGSKDEMRKKVLLALEHTDEGFGII